MKKIFPIELDEDLHRQLKHAAIDSGMTLHGWIIKVLELNVNHKGPIAIKKRKDHDAKTDIRKS
jgi:hypothetical protein